MKALPKTDECISMLEEAASVFSPTYYNGKGYFNKDSVINFQSRIKAMLDYRLLPFGVITIPYNADKEEVRINPILKNVNDFDSFWYVMQNYQLVTAKDLKNEFWEVCADLKSIPAFLDVMSLKFKSINYNYEADIEKIKKQYSGLNQHVVGGILSEQEADKIFWNIYFIADRYNFIIESIRGVYKGFREVASSQHGGVEHRVEKIKFNSLAYVLKHIYLSKNGGQPITEANKNSIAQQYGFTSGQMFRNDFLTYLEDTNRVRIHDTSKKSAKIRIAHQENAIALLRSEGNQNAVKQAELELGTLRNAYDRHY